MAKSLGELEQLILMALIDLQDNEAHGVPIRELIERRTARRLSAGAVYTVLDRLASRGLVSSRLGEPTPERGGRRKRFYRLERAGVEALARSVRVLSAMSRGLLPRLHGLLAEVGSSSEGGGR